MTQTTNYKEAFKIAIQEWNEAYSDSPQLKWNMTTIKDGFYYGQHKMQEVMNNRIDETNLYYMAETDFRIEADGPVQTRWSRKDDTGYATQKIKFVQR